LDRSCGLDVTPTVTTMHGNGFGDSWDRGSERVNLGLSDPQLLTIVGDDHDGVITRLDVRDQRLLSP
jgi:hypothetical protein